ncbi:MAG: hypothetical protein WCW33_04730 [Candidatus Babeliales bacterium]|jgi:hypothetical protein
MTDQKNPETIQPELTNQPDSAKPELTEAQQQEEFARRFLKKITVTPLSDTTKEALGQAIGTIKNLGQEIALKQNELRDKAESLKNKISHLNTLGKVKIHVQEFDPLFAKCAQFAQILDKIAQETERDIAFYTPILEGNGDEQVSIMLFEPDDFEQFIIARISSIKKHIKKTQRDLAVGSSRYFVGLDHQLRQFDALAAYVNRLK